MDYIAIPYELYSYIQDWVDAGHPKEMHWLYNGCMVRGIRLSDQYVEFSKATLKVPREQQRYLLN